MRTLILSSLLMLALASTAVRADDAKKDEPKKDDASKPAAPAAPAPPAGKPDAKTAEPARDELVFVTLTTNAGTIVLELNKAKAPISVENFVKYVDKGFYAGTVFHRVINGFMIQGGGFTKDGAQKSTEKPIKNEWQNGLKNRKYTIAMARTSVPDSATSQFYINVADNAMLDEPRGGAAYAVFGRVVAGMDVVDKIKGAATETKRTPGGAMQDWPKEDIVISEAKRITAEEAGKLLK
jgi:cyclophilin family peptidyl-prolyl cis-trans isomerase